MFPAYDVRLRKWVNLREIASRIYQFPHLDNESSSIGAVDEKMQTIEVRRRAGIREQIAILSPSDSSPAKTLSVLQSVRLQAGGKVEVCSPELSAILTPAEVEFLLSKGSEGTESAVNAFSEEKVEKFSRNGKEQLAEMSEGVMSRFLVEPEARTAVTTRLRHRKKPTRLEDVDQNGPSKMGIVGIWTPVKGMLPIYSQRCRFMVKFVGFARKHWCVLKKGKWSSRLEMRIRRFVDKLMWVTWAEEKAAVCQKLEPWFVGDWVFGTWFGWSGSCAHDQCSVAR